MPQLPLLTQSGHDVAGPERRAADFREVPLTRAAFQPGSSGSPGSVALCSSSSQDLGGKLVVGTETIDRSAIDQRIGARKVAP